MATKVQLKHSDTGLIKDGYFGFSWTTLFFGFLPALFRGDFITFLGGFTISLIVGIVTVGIGFIVINIAWAFTYNAYFTKKLLERGYALNDTDEINRQAAQVLGANLPKMTSSVEPPMDAMALDRKCPFCAENIKEEAIICRFCGRDVPPDEALTTARANRVVEAEAERVASINAQRIEDARPRGICPNCEKQIPLDSENCKHCDSNFGVGSAWKVKPLPQ